MTGVKGKAKAQKKPAAKIGHNSGNTTDAPKTVQTMPEDLGGVSGARIKSFIERIERLAEEKKVIAEDIKEVYAEAKTSGFDAAIIRKIVSLRKIKVEKRREDGELLHLYMAAIGMQTEMDV